MWEILRQSLVINPETDDFTGISDLDLLFIDGVWHLYATTRTSPGITVLTLDADTLTPVQTDRQNLTQNVTFPATGSEIIPSGNSYAIISTGRNDVALPAFAITADGEIGSSLPAVTDPFQANLLAIRSFEMSGGDYLLASAFSDGAVRLYRNSPDSGLILQDTASLSADPHTLAIAHVGGTPFALAVAENGIGNVHGQETGRWLNNCAENSAYRSDDYSVPCSVSGACAVCRNSPPFTPLSQITSSWIAVSQGETNSTRTPPPCVCGFRP